MNDASVPQVPTETIDEAVERLAEEFSFFDDWTDRYQYIIELGRKLPPFPEEWKREEFRVRGCQSRVWLVPEARDGRLWFHATSDAAIVSGLLAILLRVYSGRTAEEILATPPDFLRRLGLAEHLTPTRANGFRSAIEKIREWAERHRAAARGD
ncbi:MAG: SufE family protein [Acidobacteriota bacterium]